MVLNFRPGWTARWMAQPHYRELKLGELGAADTQRIVLDLMGEAPELAGLVARVVTQSGGNPFFAEELVRSLVQGGVLAGQRGHCRLAADAPQDLVLPATVEAVIGARLDRLDDREKSLLQIGAVIGKEFPLEVARKVARISPEEAARLLGRLSNAELIQPCRTAVGPGFTFRHPLLQEVAYAMQLRTRRARLHAAVAEAIEGFEWGQHDEFAALLAHHCEAAGKPVEAAMHLQRAARWMGRTNSAQAFAHWKKMRWLLRDQPRSDTNDRLRALASGQILNFGWREGIGSDEAKPYAEEALRYAREIRRSPAHAAVARVVRANSGAERRGGRIRAAGARSADPGRGGRRCRTHRHGQRHSEPGLLAGGIAARGTGGERRLRWRAPPTSRGRTARSCSASTSASFSVSTSNTGASAAAPACWSGWDGSTRRSNG